MFEKKNNNEASSLFTSNETQNNEVPNNNPDTNQNIIHNDVQQNETLNNTSNISDEEDISNLINTSEYENNENDDDTSEEEDSIFNITNEDSKVSITFGNEVYKDISSDLVNHIKNNIPVLPTFTEEHLSNKVNELTNIDESDKERLKDIQTKLQDQDSIETTLIKMLTSFSNQFKLLHDTLSELINKQNKKLNNTYKHEIKDPNDPEKTELIEIKDSYPKLKKSLQGKIVSAKEAKLYTLIQHRNLKKVMLPNSGVYVLLRCPILEELNILFNQLTDMVSEYGYLFGSYFYLFHDFQIKETFIEMIKKYWIEDCNIKNWRKGNTLFKNISIHDYQTILHGLCSLMFKNGYDFTIVCSNEECLYKETKTIDVNLIKHYILSSIPEEELKFLADKSIKDSKQLKKYRKNIISDINNTYQPFNMYRIHLKAPTIDEYINYGNKFNNDLIDTVHNTNNTSSLEDIESYIRYCYFKIFTPWIEKIEILNEDSSVNYIVEDTEAIEFTLGVIQNEYQGSYEEFVKPIIDFIKFSNFVMIAIPINPCPKCGTIPENTINGLLPLDIQESFFIMSTMRLILK